VTEIRSYRRVFDLERRIYTIERLRLNPSGVPVRGLAYFLAVLLFALLLGRVPLTGAALGRVPWFIAYLAVPAAVAAGLTLLRVDGRTFHQVAWSLACFSAAPRRAVALGARSPSSSRWRPPDLLFLPDGSEQHPRRLRYAGPGAVLVLVAHRLDTGRGRVKRLVVLEPVRGLRRGRPIAVGEEGEIRVVRESAGARR
jgi:hypothetical protein